MRPLIAALVLATLPFAAAAAPCGNTANGFAAWKAAFAQEAAAKGIGQRGLQALSQVQYSKGTIAADRNQKGVKYSLQDFMRIRGVDAIVAGGRKRKAANATFYASLERIYGVPAGILLAIHGMESGFGSFLGKYNVLSSNATVAYDCRRSKFFAAHMLAALEMVDRGWLDPNAIGAAHGEIGHTQFLAGNVLTYGRDGDGDGRVNLYGLSDAMASTANYLSQKGWQPGQPYGEGSRNFRVLNEWNAATVYQQAIAIAARRIDG
ncbi:lytic murein transglycosylase [Pseudooceanicola onchidii]|uniref:lytic murein transglycosylase n=1 Tax=Pseudooceanicola onchidii TaxID=2562279 RepID=UPI0010AA683C|nr:lytic murein transglycosylase [Pseudooceanicola onchidii]